MEALSRRGTGRQTAAPAEGELMLGSLIAIAVPEDLELGMLRQVRPGI